MAALGGGAATNLPPTPETRLIEDTITDPDHEVSYIMDSELMFYALEIFILDKGC